MLLLVFGLPGCGDDSGSGGGSTTTSTTGSTTSASSGSATTGSTTTSTTTGSTTASTTAATTNSSTASTGGGPLPTCMEICAEAVAIAGQLPDCSYDQAQCEAGCAQALAQVGMCDEELLLFLGCAVGSPITSWTCDVQGPTYEGTECINEQMIFESCTP